MKKIQMNSNKNVGQNRKIHAVYCTDSPILVASMRVRNRVRNRIQKIIIIKYIIKYNSSV